MEQVTQTENIRLSEQGDAIVIIDQTLLPNRVEYREIRTAGQMYDAIKHLRVRGAPAIGIFAGYAMACLAKHIDVKDPSAFAGELRSLGQYLNSSRPTAVNLSWAIGRMENVVKNNAGKTVPELTALLEKEARAIHEQDIAMCRAISEHGLKLLQNGDGVLTHCNAGPLATSRYGTALGPLLLAKERGMDIRVFADETRPLLQGARLTTYELHKAGIDVTLICDNMASIVMQNGWVQACFVGCDRVAANGDVANKIGTSGVAILAKYYQIPFYVLGPTSTVDLACKTGRDIKIEQRDPAEIKELYFKEPSALADVKAFNPAFDVTDHTLIAGIVTEKGICRAPYGQSLRAAMA
jgi:methylthioribose-1-phosphate isomerase